VLGVAPYCRTGNIRLVKRAAIVLGLAMLSGCGGGNPAPPQHSGMPQTAAASPSAKSEGFTGELPPLPKVQFASARPAPLVRAAYEFAARHPDVLRHMPCFCGCERNGHGSNADCFVSRRGKDGRPEWNAHGIGCGICIDVAHQAMQMHASGASVMDIRSAIDRKYRSEFPTSTPTPMPPH
jgi:hypothetical protein